MTTNTLIENIIQIDGEVFLNLIGIEKSLSRYLLEEQLIDILDLIESGNNNKSRNIRMVDKIQSYIYINGNTKVKWSWKFSIHKLSSIYKKSDFMKTAFSDLFTILGMRHIVHDVHLIGMFKFVKPLRGMHPKSVYRLDTTQFSFAKTEQTKEIIGLYKRINLIFIDENELIIQESTQKYLPQGSRPLINNKTTEFYLYFKESEVIKLAKKICPSKLNKFVSLASDTEIEKGKTILINEINTNVGKKKTVENQYLSTTRKRNFRETVKSFFKLVAKLELNNINNESDIYNNFRDKYEVSYWCDDVRNFMRTESELKNVVEKNSYLFIAAIFDLINSNGDPLLEDNEQIYGKYLQIKSKEAWGVKLISGFISKASKELKKMK